MIKESRIARRGEKKRKDRASRCAKRKLSIEKIVKMMFEYYRQITLSCTVTNEKINFCWKRMSRNRRFYTKLTHTSLRLQYGAI
ncbi:hypothetical protein AGMMS49936_08570 [Endomicrobiia bacterium]|nr:hypothetical protein AGMMS49936_08570 [Endomicrobiia bacterium]